MNQVSNVKVNNKEDGDRKCFLQPCCYRIRHNQSLISIF